MDRALETGMQLQADADLLAHLKARRVRTGEAVTLFNGSGGEYRARVSALEKRNALLAVDEHHDRETESPLRITLLQAISKGERMDYAVQKAVELGVAAIVPILTRHTVVRLEAERAAKRRSHWQQVAISACEQCGRNTVPSVHPPVQLDQALAEATGRRLLLAAEGGGRLAETLAGVEAVTLLVGPEGGLHPEEEARATADGFVPVALGPRILRTETAAVAALAAIQAVAGDLC